MVRQWSAVDLLAAYPKDDLARRVAFLKACDVSSRSSDESVRASTAALLEAYTTSTTAQQFADAMRERFELVEWVAAASAPAPDALMTGYATPVVDARIEESEDFRYPLFGDVRAEHPEFAALSRRELFALPAARVAVLAWVRDPLTLALVETNGTARLLLETKDGARIARITRVATNGRPWTSLGRSLAARGLLDASTSTLKDVIREAEAHPNAAHDAMLDNERVVFFASVGAAHFPPTAGLPSGTLVAGYSCAADQRIYPAGTIVLATTRTNATTGATTASLPAPPARLLFVHDVGGAINGPTRLDAYFGEGLQALERAGDMREPIRVYRLHVRK